MKKKWWDNHRHPKWDEFATDKQRAYVGRLQRQLGQTEINTETMTKREISAFIVCLEDQITMMKVANGEIDIYGLRG